MTQLWERLESKVEHGEVGNQSKVAKALSWRAGNGAQVRACMGISEARHAHLGGWPRQEADG